ncbi:response regulator transcription factor [Micromonosporaceae bacterium B7E4]
MLRVAVVDDHPIARHGMGDFLAAAPDIDVVAVAASPDELPRADDGTLGIDVLVLDLYLSDDEPCVTQIARLSGEVAILVMSASRSPVDVLAAVQMGALGYVTKHTDADALAEAVRAVGARQFHLAPHLADIIQSAIGARPEPLARPVLSPREQDTLTYLARGFTHQQTATRMGVSKTTVDTYVARIRAKLHVGNKAELTMAALRYVEWRQRGLPWGGTGAGS